MLESNLVIFGDIGWECYNAFVCPFKRMEYRLLFSENMLSNIISGTDWMQKVRSVCMCFTSQFPKWARLSVRTRALLSSVPPPGTLKRLFKCSINVH